MVMSPLRDVTRQRTNKKIREKVGGTEWPCHH